MNDLIYKSVYYDLRNTDHEWSDGDTKERYEYNLAHKYRELSNLGWVGKHISYKLNSQGFRCEDFDDDDCAIFLGCSYTFGTGLPLENTFAHIVSNTLNLKCFNLGQPGGSNDTAFRLAYTYIPKLKPKLVVLNTVQTFRLELISKDSSNNPDKTFSFLNTCSCSIYNTFYDEWIYNDTNSFMNYHKNLLAIKYLCSLYGSKFVETESIKMLYEENCRDFARDLQHPGLNCNKKYADLILNSI